MKINIDMKKFLPVFLLGALAVLVVGTAVLFIYFTIVTYHHHQQEKYYAQEIISSRELLEKRNTKAAGIAYIQGKKSSMLARDLNNLAMKNNLHVTSLEPANVEDDKGSFYKQAFFAMEADASFKDLGIFLDEVMGAPDTIFDINSLSVLSDNADPKRVKAKISFVVIVGKEYGQK